MFDFPSDSNDEGSEHDRYQRNLRPQHKTNMNMTMVILNLFAVITNILYIVVFDMRPVHAFPPTVFPSDTRGKMDELAAGPRFPLAPISICDNFYVWLRFALFHISTFRRFRCRFRSLFLPLFFLIAFWRSLIRTLLDRQEKRPPIFLAPDYD